MSSSKHYWERREAEALKRYTRDERGYQRQLKEIYQDMLDSVQKEIDSFYARYAGKEGITLAEAKRRVSKLDIAAYERKAKKYVKEKNFSDQANEEMRLYNLTMKVNRLELLKANIGLELVSGHDEQEKFLAELLKGRTMEELERQAGILGKTIRDNAKLAGAIPNASFHNATFSDRIWSDQERLKAELSKLLQTGLIQGKNPRALGKDLKKVFATSNYNAERLMRTELARVQTEAQKQSFLKNGFTEYTFHANHGCCAACSALDGKHFQVKDMLPGKNAPPMHPNCRCSTSAYEDSEEYEAWLDFLEQGGTTEEWNASGRAAWEKKKNGAVAEDGKRVILKQMSDGTIPITQAAIDRIPNIRPTEWTESQADALQTAHRELLAFIKDEPAGEEAGFICDMRGAPIQKVKGTRGSVTIPREEAEHIVLHNHPDGRMFSHPDLENFILRDGTVALSAVGNDGSVYLMVKQNSYDGFSAYQLYQRKKAILDEKIKARDEVGYIETIYEFLKEAEKCGIEFIERTT